MSKLILSVEKALLSKQVVKVITGLANLDVHDVINKVKAAEIAGATYVDIAAHPDLVILVKSIVSIPICVSSIHPRDLYQCILVGADMVEIGNFDIFYFKNITFSYDQIINIAQETKSLLQNINICVTVPHYLLLEQQVKLARHLKQIGINCIQTEGWMAKSHNKNNSAIFRSITNSSSALSSSYAINNSIDIPIIAASGINSTSAPIAISYGASGVALGSVLNNFKSITAISSYIREVIDSMYYYGKNEYKQIHATKYNFLLMRFYNRLTYN
uniref:Uncharacterized protein ycf23 n=1 Tax=Eucheuma denticulatum TaxID=305493 RepID=A0A8E7PGB2_9FLOR|nr:hypothetical protein [Eucheuma denticulatum]